MTVKFADRVFETSTTQGTGTINLAGPAEGFRSFVEGVDTGAKVPYVIDDGEDWEIGLGTVTDGTPDTLSRDTVFASSNSNALVNWGPGTRNVRLAPVSSLLLQRDEKLNIVEGYVIGAGNATVQTATLAPAPLGLSAGMRVYYTPPASNTGALTLNLNGLGAKSIKMPDGSDPVANTLLSSGIYELVYNGTNFILIGASASDALKARGSAIASASTVNLGAADSDFVEISGTTAITSLGTSTARNHVWVKFQGALTLTHNATSLILPTGANIATAAGDIAEFVRISGGNWQCLSYIRASGKPVAATAATDLPAGTIIQTAYAESTANTSCSGSIPLDDTAPEITEGTEFLTRTFTPLKASSKLLITVRASFGGTSNNTDGAYSIFSTISGVSTCIDAGFLKGEQTGDDEVSFCSQVMVDALTTDARTFSVRAGRQSGAFILNTFATGTPIFGGKSKATITVQEIAQ